MNAVKLISEERSKFDDALLTMIRDSGLSDVELEATISALTDAFRRLLNGKGTSGKKARCSFCHRSQSEVKRIVVGTQAAICDECIAIARNTIQEPKGLPPVDDPGQ
jgi:ClpX C4-type zinc finger protein